MAKNQKNSQTVPAIPAAQALPAQVLQDTSSPTKIGPDLLASPRPSKAPALQSLAANHPAAIPTALQLPHESLLQLHTRNQVQAVNYLQALHTNANQLPSRVAFEDQSQPNIKWIPLKSIHRQQVGVSVQAIQMLPSRITPSPLYGFRASERYTDAISLFTNANPLQIYAMLCSGSIHLVSDLPRLPIVILKNVNSSMIPGSVEKRIVVYPFEDTHCVEHSDAKAVKLDLPDLLPYAEAVPHVIVPFGSLGQVTTTEAHATWLAAEASIPQSGPYPKRKFYYNAPVPLIKNTFVNATIIPLRFLTSSHPYRGSVKIKDKSRFYEITQKLQDHEKISYVHINSNSTIRIILSESPTWPIVNEISNLVDCQVKMDFTPPLNDGISSEGITENGRDQRNGRESRPPLYALSDAHHTALPSTVVQAICTALHLIPAGVKWSSSERFILKPTTTTHPPELTIISGRYLLVKCSTSTTRVHPDTIVIQDPGPVTGRVDLIDHS